MKLKHIKFKNIVIIAFLLIVLFVVVELFVSRCAISVSYYSVSTDKVSENVRIVLIADLHNSEFGADNSRLVEKIEEQEPDIIVIAGDMINSSAESTEIAEVLIEQLCAVAPVYISLGNHEIEYAEKYGADIAAIYESAGGEIEDSSVDETDTAGDLNSTENAFSYGMTADTQINSLENVFLYGKAAEAKDVSSEDVKSIGDPDDGAAVYPCVVLDYEYVDIEVNGQDIRLGGIYGYCLPQLYLETGEADEEECLFLSEMQDTDLYTILMCHMPVCWTLNNGINEWDIDLVLTGHTHGGQVIIPGIGGLWAPDMGFFPGKLEGIVTSDDGGKVLVYTRGLGSNELLPRFNNIPEIVVMEITAEHGSR